MSLFDDEEDNNPFAGSNHLFASGIGGSIHSADDDPFIDNTNNRDHFSTANIFGDHLRGSGSISDHPNGQSARIDVSNDAFDALSSSTIQHEDLDSFGESTPTHGKGIIKSGLLGDESTTAYQKNTASSSPESWINYKPSSLLLSDNETSIIDNAKQEEYERGLMDHANTTISSNNPLDFYSESEATPYEIIHNNTGIQIDIPYIIQLKDRKNKVVIVYIIKLKNLEIRRRYSDFDKLRKILGRIYPNFLLPSLPEKHSFRNYMKNPLNVQKSDVKFIEHRKRSLRSFLNRLISYPNYNPAVPEDIPPIRFNDIFLKFLDPTISNFQDILKMLPIPLLQNNPLLNDPLNPYKISPYHNLLPNLVHTSLSNYDQAVRGYMMVLDREKRKTEELRVDSPKKALTGSTVNDANTSLSSMDVLDDLDLITFEDYEYFKSIEKYISSFARSLRPVISCESRVHGTLEDLIKNLSKLGAYFNAFSLEYNFTMTFQPDFKIPHNEKSGIQDNEEEPVVVADDDIQHLKENLTKSQNKDFEKFYTLASAIEKVGQSIDNEFINIEMLEFSLMTSFSEPLMEINSMLKNCLTEVIKFKKLKDLQYLTINKRLRDKRKALKTYLDIDLKYQKLQEVLKNSINESNTMKQAYQRLEIQKQKQMLKEQKQYTRHQPYQNLDDSSEASFSTTEDSEMNSNLVLNEEAMTLPSSGSSFSWLNLFTGKAHSPEHMSKMQRNQEIRKLRKEIAALQHLSAIVSNDVKQVNSTLKINMKNLMKFLRVEVNKLNLKFVKIFLKFFRENLSHWENVNHYVNNNIYDLKFNYKYDNRIPRYIRYPQEDLLKKQMMLQPQMSQNGEVAANKRLKEDYLEEQIAKHNANISLAIANHRDPSELNNSGGGILGGFVSDAEDDADFAESERENDDSSTDNDDDGIDDSYNYSDDSGNDTL
ncbi:hypothetical protein DASC09_057410 [Saccharomycopsis crataegensis]|uniref:PX domain-containing protein n=1 Tax=Saccharomycopsis crataegensis TaxID=43959 RepID=A0AAV5QV02_9ASCO|nr:hypothetical protein DASC09_057410 [Saccharomycopsis crataegensis]